MGYISIVLFFHFLYRSVVDWDFMPEVLLSNLYKMWQPFKNHYAYKFKTFKLENNLDNLDEWAGNKHWGLHDA